MEFKAGDRVRLLVDSPEGNCVLMTGDTGIVISPAITLGWVGVEWDVEPNTHLHHLDGQIEEDKGWYVDPDWIELLFDDEDEVFDPASIDLSLLLGV